jgi:hypothetical protein
MSAGRLEVPKQVEAKIEAERRRLQKASAVLTGAVLAAEEGVDAEIVADAVSVGRELVDAAVNGLDAVELRRARQGDAS